MYFRLYRKKGSIKNYNILYSFESHTFPLKFPADLIYYPQNAIFMFDSYTGNLPTIYLIISLKNVAEVHA